MNEEDLLQKRIEIERSKLKDREYIYPSFVRACMHASFVAVEMAAIDRFEAWIEEMRKDWSVPKTKHGDVFDLRTKWFEKWLGKPK